MEDIDVAMPHVSFPLDREDHADNDEVDGDEGTREDSGGDKTIKKKNSPGGGITLSGLLHAIVRTTNLSGVGSAELFDLCRTVLQGRKEEFVRICKLYSDNMTKLSYFRPG